MVSQIFRLFSILSGLIAVCYVIFTWNNFTNKSIFTLDFLAVFTFVFGGIDNLLSKQKSMKILGIFYFAVAIFITFVSISKFD